MTASAFSMPQCKQYRYDHLAKPNSNRELYRIMWRVIDSLYGGNIACDEPPTELDVVTRLFKIEQDLIEWQKHLPLNMGLRNSQDILAFDRGEDPLIERYRIILTLRYHNIRVLLHRPILVKFLDISQEQPKKSQEPAFSQHLGFNSLRICIQSSEEIISMVYTLVTATAPAGSSQHGILGAWWFSLYYST